MALRINLFQISESTVATVGKLLRTTIKLLADFAAENWTPVTRDRHQPGNGNLESNRLILLT